MTYFLRQVFLPGLQLIEEARQVSQQALEPLLRHSCVSGTHIFRLWVKQVKTNKHISLSSCSHRSRIHSPIRVLQGPLLIVQFAQLCLPLILGSAAFAQSTACETRYQPLDMVILGVMLSPVWCHISLQGPEQRAKVTQLPAIEGSLAPAPISTLSSAQSLQSSLVHCMESLY